MFVGYSISRFWLSNKRSFDSCTTISFNSFHHRQRWENSCLGKTEDGKWGISFALACKTKPDTLPFGLCINVIVNLVYVVVNCLILSYFNICILEKAPIIAYFIGMATTFIPIYIVGYIVSFLWNLNVLLQGSFLLPPCIRKKLPVAGSIGVNTYKALSYNTVSYLQNAQTFSRLRLMYDPESIPHLLIPLLQNE